MAPPKTRSLSRAVIIGLLELDNHILLGFQVAHPIYETAARYGLALEFIDVEAFVVI